MNNSFLQVYNVYKLYFLELHGELFSVMGTKNLGMTRCNFTKTINEKMKSARRVLKRKNVSTCRVCVIYICELCMYIHIRQYFYTHYHVFNNMNIIAGAYICVHVCFCIMYVSRNMDAMLCLYSTHVHYILFSESN